MKKSVKNKESLSKKRLKIAAISGVVGIVISLLAYLINFFFALPVIGIISNILTAIASIIFIYGFFILGKIYKNKILRVTSVILIILTLIMGILIPISAVSLQEKSLDYEGKLINAGIDPNAANSDLTDEQGQIVLDLLIETFSPVFPLIIVLLLSIFATGVTQIVFFSGMIKLKNKVKYSKLCGILGIIGIGLMMLIVGFILMIGPVLYFMAYIFQIVILFNESK